METNKLKWEAYGDVNPLEHGGLWLQPDNTDCFQAVELVIHPDGEGGVFYLIGDGYVDITDNWIDWEVVTDTMGTQEDDSEIHKARDVFSYYGVFEWDGDLTKCDTLDEAKELLKSYGISVEN